MSEQEEINTFNNFPIFTADNYTLSYFKYRN